MFCDKCGNELKEGALFCTNCGKKVKEQDKTKKGKKLVFIIIPVVLLVAIIIGLIFINKNNSERINNLEQSKMTANKQLVREDSTAPRGVTYNFKLEDVKNAMDKACKENNTDNYLDFEYTRSENNVDFYEAYKDETKNYGCLMKVMVYNDYVMSISFVYYDGMKEELSAGGYNVFFNILKDNYSEEYSNKIKSILENLENEKYEYYENTICYKEVQDNFGTTEYSITASTIESYNELEGMSSNDTANNGLNEQTNDTNNTQNEKEVIKRTIESYAKLTTQYDGYNLRYAYYGQYARSQNGEDVYKITYLTGYTGLYYVRLVSLDSTNTKINKKTDLCKETLGGPQLIVETAYKQTWGSLNYSSNTTNNSNKSNSSSSNSQKETVEVPYFTMGYELQEYTSKLDNLGISYKIVKGQDLNYSNNTVISVEHNGEKVEKGTTITITVADNVYDMKVMVNTGYLLGLADLGYDYESVNLLIKINGTTICNGTFERTDTRTSMPITVGTYKGKTDNLTLDITIEGKKITKSINYKYVEAYQGIVIYKGGDIGPQG